MKKKKRIIFEVPEELHKQIKISAALRNISMSLWITRELVRKLALEESLNTKGESSE